MKQIIKILLALYCFNATALFAQDVITLKSGDEIKAKVLEISPGEVKYKKHESPDGPTYTLTKSEVFMIKYENGEKEVFNSTTTTTSTTTAQVQSSVIGRVPITQGTGINTVIVKKLPQWRRNYLTVMQVAPYSSAYNAGLWTMDVITHIDGVSIDGLTEEAFYERTQGNKSVKLSVLRKKDGENQKLEITCDLSPWYIRGTPDYAYVNSFKIWENLKDDVNYRKWSAQKGMYADKLKKFTDLIWEADSEVDFFDYNTFDFEYGSVEEPLKEKALAERMIPYLFKGLKRDRENPDLLIALSFYEGKESTYIPPREQIVTRYKTEYNWNTKQRETRQYVESNTKGNYTQNTYMISLKVCILDAEKAKSPDTKIPPIIWQTATDRTYKSKPDFVEQTNNMLSWVMAYPFTNVHYRGCDYTFYGLFFDEQGGISDILPDSPADKAGLKPGDKIIAVNNMKIYGYKRIKYSKLLAVDIFCGRRDIFLRDFPDTEYWNSMHQREHDYEVGTLTLTVQRGKQKIDLQVTPVRTIFPCIVGV
jgi:C-terminal processing protease CtpA/Prc